MAENAKLAELHLKFADRPWNDTIRLVRRCMEKSRDQSKPCEPLNQALKRLQEVCNGSPIDSMRSRLEMIAKQQGMGFHITETTCYLTADLFYLEVVVLPCGSVEEVKVAPHGKLPVPSEFLLQLLRSEMFADFSMKLEGLFTQYNIPGNNEIKLKLLASLQYLGKDLQHIAHLPCEPKSCDSQMDLINIGKVGYLIAGKQDFPLAIQFYMPPTDEMTSDSIVQTAQITVGASNVTHKLQMASMILQPPQLDSQGYPVFAPMSNVPHEVLPACFLLKLQPTLPMISSFVKKLSQITEVAIPDTDLQWAPLTKLLMRGSPSANSQWKTLDDQETYTTPLPGGVIHHYILPGAAWDVPAQRGPMVDSIPFTHPAHVPALLDVLRHQCAFNTLLRSCFNFQCVSPDSVCDLNFEVLPESETSFSVTFHRPHTNSLAVLLVNVCNAHQITCHLFGAGTSDSSIDEYISTVMKRCMSIPVTMRTLYSKLEEIALTPLDPSLPAATEAKNDQSDPSSTDATDPGRDSNKSQQSAAVPEDLNLPGSVLIMPDAKSEPQPEAGTGLLCQPLPVRSCRRSRPQDGK